MRFVFARYYLFIHFLTTSVQPQAIRKKIESELSRKRTISTHQSRPNKRSGKAAPTKGTVAALKPSPALTVPENITVAEASQLCAAKRTDCVLVVDDEEGLSGIFTAKDLAYRVTFSLSLSSLACDDEINVLVLCIGHC
jgi:signal-transduction protein with cAMP-binding, CBS, and nucleotidyltransferase domain